MNRISGNRAYAKPHNNMNDGVGAGEERQKSQRLADIFDLISDDKSLHTFDTISLSCGFNGDILTTQLKLTTGIIQG